MTGGGGRREGENIGRSRVPARRVSGMAQSGFPRTTRSTLTGGGNGVAVSTGAAGAAGNADIDEMDAGQVRPDIPVSNASAAVAAVETHTPTRGASTSASRPHIGGIALCSLISLVLAEMQANARLVSPDNNWQSACTRAAPARQA